MDDSAFGYRKLPISARIQLAQEIWDSVAEETPSPFQLSPEERAELDRRLAEHRADPASSIAWEVVRAELMRDA